MIMGDFTQIEHSLSHILPQLFGALILPIVALIGLAFLDWRMAAAMFIALPVAVLIVLASSGVQRSLGSRHIRAKINAASRLQEYLNGIRVIKAYNLSGSRFVRLEKAFRELMRESIRLEGLLGPVFLLAVASVRAGLTVLVLVGVYLLLGGTLDILTFVIFLVIGARVFDPLTTALISFPEFRYHALAGERILTLQREPVMQGSGRPPEEHDIEFASVTFGYGSGAVLHDVSLRMPEGSLTALVGPSGSGKSTVLKLVARFYDPQSGRVFFGGDDVRGMDPEALLTKISMVFQDVYLFKDTIGNNIRFGREGATQAEVEDAARKACCHEFIMKLPLGYDTPVGEGGTTLSGGEKQRISIARAILKDAPVVLLDEATAFLDPENEVDVQKAISALVAGRTVVMIAHRLKTVRRADNIIVLDGGRVVEQGKHDDLLARGGLYSRLWTLQQEAQGWSIAG
jgi:ATP-binding cassette subfamily B protein